jgi:hypothetical protein
MTEQVSLDFTLIESLLVYYDYGLDPGGCGHYVLLHDLENAQPRAHELARHTTPDMIRWVKANLPAECQGTIENINAWKAHDGFRRLDSVTAIMMRLDEHHPLRLHMEEVKSSVRYNQIKV